MEGQQKEAPIGGKHVQSPAETQAAAYRQEGEYHPRNGHRADQGAQHGKEHQGGARRVKQELRRKGIADDVIEAVLAEFSTDRDETEENIRAILERKYPGAWTDEKVRRRAVAALQRYGYGFEEIFSVLNAEGPEE